MLQPTLTASAAVLLLGTTLVLPNPSAGPNAGTASVPAITSVVVHPERIELTASSEYAQLLLGGNLGDGTLQDVTRFAEIERLPPHLSLDERGLVRPLTNGEGELTLRVGQHTVVVPYSIHGLDEQPVPSFRRDVMPILTRTGCNAGGCHGAADGQNGFQLSLRGYDPELDHMALTDDLSARRFDRTRPERSLFLLKPTAGVPHEGGQIIEPGSHDYNTLLRWVEHGARYDVDATAVSSIEVLPSEPTIQKPGESQQFAVLAHYSDGGVRDVTAHAFVETNSTEITAVDDRGLVTGLRRGEAAIMARYEGHYAATRLFVMGDRAAWRWEEVPEYNYVDTLVYQKLRTIRSLPSDVCTDAEFVRRAYLDLTGIPPTARETRIFLMDERPERTKRAELVERLIGSPDFVEFWTNKWCDLLQVNPKFLGREGTEVFREWIETCVASNTPYDDFVRQVLDSSGSTYEAPPTAFYKILREPDVAMEATTQLFLGTRFNCNKCHDHPFERWTQKNHWELSAFFANVGRKNVEGSTPLSGGVTQEELIDDSADGEVRYPDSPVVAPAAFPFEHDGEIPADATLRAQLADWITAPENPYFASSFVNRIWSYFTGVGLIDPVDDIRATNPPTNPELLERLTDDFVASGFDVRTLMRTICNSRVYQHSVETNEWNEHDELNYSHALARRLPAEVLYDAVHRATGARTHLPGVRPGTRAMQLVDANVSTPDGFMQLFGKPPRESVCECERSSNVSLGQALNLVNGPTIADAIRAESGTISELVAIEQDPAAIVEELYLSFLCRFPTDTELAALAPTLVATDPANRTALAPEAAAELERRRAEWESRYDDVPEWRPLIPVSAVGTASATFAIEGDGSVLVGGELPEKDVYTIVAAAHEGPITGIRLEVLPDESLGGMGPGRAENGNFVLNDLRVSAVPIAMPMESSVIELKNASANFSQGGWAVAGAIDDKPASGWAVSPRFGERHEAYFETAEDVTAEGGVLLLFTLSQNYGQKHVIGKLRLSVTSSPRPVRHHGLPGPVASALAIAAEDRSAEQEATIYAHFMATQPDLLELVRRSAAQDLAWALANSPAFLFNR